MTPRQLSRQELEDAGAGWLFDPNLLSDGPGDGWQQIVVVAMFKGTVQEANALSTRMTSVEGANGPMAVWIHGQEDSGHA
jgi:hypothetical protein